MDRTKLQQRPDIDDYVSVDKPPTRHADADILTIGTFFDFARIKFKDAGNLQMLDHNDRLHDNGGKELPCNYLIETDNVHLAAQIARELNMGIVMIGALTSATNNFPQPKAQNGLRGILAIKPKGIVNEKALHSTAPENRVPNKSDQVCINKDRMTVTVGAGLSFGQVNKILAEELGSQYFVPVDLTTVDQALAGAVYATGAMGPSRIRINEISERVNITDGLEIKTITGDEIEENEGLMGLAGGVTEIELRILKRPSHRFGLSIALQDTHQNPWINTAAKLLTALKSATNLHLSASTMESDWPKGFIDGLEIITREDLELIFNNTNSSKMRNEAFRLLNELAEANADYMLYLTGNSTENLLCLSHDNSPNNPLNILMELMDQNIIGPPTGYEGHQPLEQMRQLRETIPDMAREQARIKATVSNLSFSTSTDINICINPEAFQRLTASELQELFNKMLQPFYDYEQALTELKQNASTKNVAVEVHRYGHLQPRSMDPHTRATAKSDKVDEARFNEVVEQIKALKEALSQALRTLTEEDSRIELHHGEKGKIPNLKALSPNTLKASKTLIASAGPNWNFRSPF